jgi:predicted transcriptional regulator of viral defense system
MATTDTDQILRLARHQGLVRAADLRAAGLSSQLLLKLYQAGRLQRVARGVYSVPSHMPSEHRSLAQAAVRVPKGVVCLLSALQWHQLGTQLPHEVWLAVPPGTASPKQGHPPLRLVRFSGASHAEGVEVVRVEGVEVHVYGVAKTLCDCFKLRNKVGLDVALEALKQAWRERRFAMDELFHFARVDRVEKVMRPYVEALVA